MSSDKFRLRIATDTEEDLQFLKTRSKEVTFPITSDQVELIDQLTKYTLDRHGLGMSAVQLGVHDRIFVMRTHPSAMMDDVTVVINPKITKNDSAPIKMLEGCFSFPDSTKVIGPVVSRASTIWVEYYDEFEVLHKNVVLGGLPSRIFQHEFDHLNGKLMSDSPHFIKWVML